jgi:Concanavalin A-like lectin/glucanases superfamily
MGSAKIVSLLLKQERLKIVHPACNLLEIHIFGVQIRKTMRITILLLTLLGLGSQLSAQTPCITNTNSLSFTNAAVTFNSDVNLAPDSFITVEAWIRPTSMGLNNYDNSIVCKHSWSQGEQGYVLRSGNGQVDFSVCGKDANGASISWVGATSPAASITINTWYHVAGTYDGDSVRIYINGVQKDATALPDGMIPGLAYPIAIGKLSDGSQFQTRYFSGQIDEVRIWNRALDASDILSRYNHHLDPAQETGLVGYWRFNEGSGGTVNDQTSSGNNGSTSATTWSTLVPWNLNGQPIANATTQSWVAVANGSYTVTITDTAGCSATSGPYIITGVGLEEISGSQVWVNHQEETLQIIAKNGQRIEKVEIFSISGQRLIAETCQAENCSVHTGRLNKGIYQGILYLQNGDAKSFRFLAD